MLTVSISIQMYVLISPELLYTSVSFFDDAVVKFVVLQTFYNPSYSLSLMVSVHGKTIRPSLI